jgi:uncharacterized protein YndB with AHSA1/START domain
VNGSPLVRPRPHREILAEDEQAEPGEGEEEMKENSMAEQTAVVHGTFRIERTYPVSPSRVFSAFASSAAKRRWFAESKGAEAEEFTLDFRVGGREVTRFRFKGDPALAGAPPAGTEFRNDSVYQDIVPDRRIVLAYTMSVGDRRISASLATVELAPAGEGTRLAFTEQAAFFEGSDGPELREKGWSALLEALGADLRRPQ